MIVHRHLGRMPAALQAQDDVRFPLALAIEELPQLAGPLLNLLQLRRRQLHLPACICDSHTRLQKADVGY